MVTPRYLVLVVLSGTVLALGGTAFAQARVDAKAKPELPQCTPELLKSTDCHVHDAGTHMQVSGRPPSTARPHAHLEYQEWMRALHRR